MQSILQRKILSRVEKNWKFYLALWQQKAYDCTMTHITKSYDSHIETAINYKEFVRSTFFNDYLIEGTMRYFLDTIFNRTSSF